MSDIKNVTIIGAGGNLGPSILKAFLDSSSFNVTVLSREGSKSTFPSGVRVVRADYNSIESLTTAFKGQDAVVSLVGGMALGDQNKLIDGAIAAGVKRFLPSEYGCNTIDPKAVAIVPVFESKAQTVEYLKSKENQISWTSVITGPFFDWGLKTGFLGFDLAAKKATLFNEGTEKVTTSNLHQIGLSVVKALENSSLTRNKYVSVKSFDTTQVEILAAIEKASGEKWTVNKVSSKDWIEEGNQKIKNQDFSGIYNLIQGVAFGGLGDNAVLGDWNEKLGVSQENLLESVKAALSG